MQFSSPDDGRKSRLKHVERLTEINKLRNVASFWLYPENMLSSGLFIIDKAAPWSSGILFRGLIDHQ